MASVKTKTGFSVSCPKCGALEGLNVVLHSLAVECSERSEEVTRADLERMIADARRLLAWLDLAETV
ncbi:MAG: hypothetical protein LC745_06965 [Planctomycetia bacterium]|nr:hypothetical protein [Planctomycetia bacterium]